MADGDGADPALCRSSLTRIIDDERIDHGYRPAGAARPAFRGERHCLAGEPFGGAVSAQMNDGVNLLQSSQTKIKGKIAVARRAFGIMVEALAILSVSSVGLQGDKHIAGMNCTEAECPVRKGRVVLNAVPALINGITLFVRQRVEPCAVSGKR